VLVRVAAGVLPETLRLALPGPMVAFGRLDAVRPSYPAAVRAARAAGFEAVLRLAGGHAAVFHEGTIVLAHAIPDPDPRSGIDARYESTAELVAGALRGLGIETAVGEIPGEYCAGSWSVSAAGRVKLAGLGQRLIGGAAFVGGVVVVEGAERVREALVPVYRELGIDWDPGTVGAVADEAAGVGVEDVIEALRVAYAERSEIVEGELDADTLELARRLAPDHRSG
jgi:octanoyl-[GcvH]:protein N-octanoyltransferase